MGIEVAKPKAQRSEQPEPNLASNRRLSGMKLFSGNAHPALAARIAEYLGVELGRLTVTKFADGESRVVIEESARGNEIFLVQPTCSPTNDNCMELFIMLDAFRRASASRITVVMPYYGYARQDKKVKPREPITAKMIAGFIEKCGADRVVALDLHAEQLQGFFDIPVDHLYGYPIIGQYLLDQGYGGREDVVVVSPDVAGVGRARTLAEMLDCPFVVIAKRRPAPNQVEVVEIVGEFRGKTCVMIDDMVDTGGSIISGAEALLTLGARDVMATCSHAILSNGAAARIQGSVISRLITLDTVPIADADANPKITVLTSAPLIGEAISRIHRNESISTLFRQSN